MNNPDDIEELFTHVEGRYVRPGQGDPADIPTAPPVMPAEAAGPNKLLRDAKVQRRVVVSDRTVRIGGADGNL